MMQISPLSRHTPKCLRSLSMDFTLVKASSAVLRQSYLTMSLLALSPSPIMQQQLPWGKQTDCGVPAQLYLVPYVSASLEWEMRFMAAMGCAAKCFWSCVREYRQHCPSSLVKRWKWRMRSWSGVALEMVNIFSKLCSKLVSRLKIRSFSMAVLKERIFFTKIQLKQLSKQRTQCKKSCLQNKCSPSSQRFQSRATSRCRTCYDRPITSSSSSSFQRTWLEQTRLMLLRNAYSLALISLPISSNLASNYTNPGLFTIFSSIYWFFLARTPFNPVRATLPTRSASSPAYRHPSCYPACAPSSNWHQEHSSRQWSQRGDRQMATTIAPWRLHRCCRYSRSINIIIVQITCKHAQRIRLDEGRQWDFLINWIWRMRNTVRAVLPLRMGTMRIHCYQYA